VSTDQTVPRFFSFSTEYPCLNKLQFNDLLWLVKE
jgi:hypothetical protein